MDVVFAVMPFLDASRPAIGVSLLKAHIARQGFSSRILYFNLEMAESIGVPLYLTLANLLGSDSLVGEWFFADTVFGDDLPHEQEYVSKILPHFGREALISDILRARSTRHEFVENCVQKIQSLDPRVVGFTTTFHQTCAGLAVARRLKQSASPPIVIFGGANCEGEMGMQLLRSFPWIDYVCTREGDVAFPMFLDQLLHEGDEVRVPGILKQGSNAELTTPEMVSDLDSLPMPDYADYFEQLNAAPIRSQVQPCLLIETSRGCWWGAKHHCTFCGLNGDTMAFRSKSPRKALEEMAFLSNTYGIKRIDCVDNILDMRYVQTLFPRLAESDLNLQLFYEVKANLRYDQLATLRAGGVRAIQPGIESFSNQVLRLMKKGCTGLQNIQLLRWCEELDVQVAWNLLAGFPGESPTEYKRMAELIPLLVHLTPPVACSPIRLDRFSPFFTRVEEFGLLRVRPARAYYYVFPLGKRDLTKLAYFFDFDYPSGMNPMEHLAPVTPEVGKWWQLGGLANRDARGDPVVTSEVGTWWQSRGPEPGHRPRLDAWQEEEAVVISDSRPCAVHPSHRLLGAAAQAFLLCDSAQGIASLLRQLTGDFDGLEVREALAELIARKVMVEVDGQYLSLAVMRKRLMPKTAGESNAYVQIQEAAPAQPLLRSV